MEFTHENMLLIFLSIQLFSYILIFTLNYYSPFNIFVIDFGSNKHCKYENV